MDNDRIGKFILLHRREIGMTQEELAQRLNVTGKAVSKWETGQGCPDIGSVPALAAALGVTADALLAAGQEGVSAPGSSAEGPKAASPQAGRGRRLLLGLSAGASLLAAFTCVLVDFIIERKLGWSLYLLGGVALHWTAILPLMVAGKRWKAFLSLGAFTAAALAYLGLVEGLSASGPWFLALGLPITLTTALAVGCALVLLRVKRMSRLAAIGLIIIVFGVGLEFAIQRLVDGFVGSGGSDWLSAAIVMLASTFVGLGLLLLSLLRGKRS
jgi:transcriptional regulator with XRE-family HTH domain